MPCYIYSNKCTFLHFVPPSMTVFQTFQVNNIHTINEKNESNHFKIDREKDGDDIVLLFLKHNNRLQEEYRTIDDIFTLTTENRFWVPTI